MPNDFGWTGPDPVKVQPGDFAIKAGTAIASTAATSAAASAAAGAAGAAGAGAAASVGFLGIPVFGWILIGVSLIGSFLLRGKKKGPPPEAKGIRLGTPVDANAPWTKVYGAPWSTPPLLTQWIEPDRLNSTVASATKGNPKKRADGRLVSVLHTGAGAVDGGGLEVRYAGIAVTDTTVTEDSPSAQRTLAHKTGSGGSVWKFPHFEGDLIESSVTITADSVLIFQAGNSGDDASDGQTTETVSNKNCKAENFTRGGAFLNSNRDDNIPTFETRVGCYLPTVNGDIDDKSVTATIQFGQSSALVAYKLSGSNRTTSVGAKTYALKPEDWGRSITEAGKTYFYVRKVTRSDNGAQAGAVASSSSVGITGFTLSYSVKSGAREVNLVQAPDGSWEAQVSPPLSTSAVVTATYRTTSSFEDASYSFRHGTLDQKPASDNDAGFFGAVDGTRNTVLVGLELTQYTKRTYTTAKDADDVLVCIQSGERGFYASSSDGELSSVARTIEIAFKEDAAADAGATLPNDPSTGWVVLKNPNPDPKFGDAAFRLHDYFVGTGQWFFSIADLFEFTRTGKWKPDRELPPGLYDVAVTALDTAGTDFVGKVNTDRVFSQIYFANATEVRRVGLVLPRQSTLTVALGPDTERGGRFDVRFAGATVVKASSAAATVGADGLPTPRTVGYSKNPVWCACDLITDEMAGGGRVFSWESIDIESAYDAAAWCDETITFRDGSTGVRSQCDVVIGEDGRKPLGEWLATILAGSGVMCYWKSGTWRFVVDEDADPVTDPVTSAAFTIVEEQDCLPGACELTFTETEERPTELVVQFRDSENMDAESQEPLYFDDPQPTPRITERVEFPAVRRRKQARHFGGILLRQMRLATRRLTMVGTIGRGLRFTMLEPGDIVYVTSTRLGLSAVTFRVMTVGFTSQMRPALELVEHVPSAYTDSFAGPNSGVQPGLRTASDTPVPSQLKVSHVTGVQLQTVGGAP